MSTATLPVVQLGPANVRRKCCGTCACRRDNDIEGYYPPDELAADGEEFHCHEGMSDDVAMDAVLWTTRPDGTPTKADGSPADLCAGWWAYRRKALRDQQALTTPQGPA